MELSNPITIHRRIAVKKEAVAIVNNKEVIVRSNLTIYFVPRFEDIPEYCAANQLRIIASLPCYLEDNVDKMRGNGVYNGLKWSGQLVVTAG